VLPLTVTFPVLTALWSSGFVTVRKSAADAAVAVGIGVGVVVGVAPFPAQASALNISTSTTKGISTIDSLRMSLKLFMFHLLSHQRF